MHRRFQFAHNDRSPGAPGNRRMFGHVIEEAASATPFLDALAERGVEFDTAIEKESGDRSMLKTAGREEGLRHRGGVSAGKILPHSVIVTQCRQGLEIAWQNSLTRKELQHSPGAGANCPLPYLRGIRSGPSVQKKFGAFDARECLFPERIAAIAK